MIPTRRRNIEFLTISALDLFASAMGVFVLITIILFPYYLKQPAQEAEIDGAQAELAALGQAYEDARLMATQAAEKRAVEAAKLERARDSLRQAEASAAEAGTRRDLAERLASAAAEMKASQQSRPRANFAMSDLDLVFVMDATGSMDDEIADVQANLLGLVRVLERLAPTLNVGFVAFKDQGDEYLVRIFPLTPMRGANLSRIQGFVRQLSASGGGDFPEPVARALALGVEMAWRPDAEGRIVVIGDAPSHDPDWIRAFETAAGFARPAAGDVGSRQVSAIFTGSRGSGRAFFERLAEAGRGDFVQHRGQIIESVLLSVLDEGVRWKRRET